jgi:type I restriction enzyme S subunit
VLLREQKQTVVHKAVTTGGDGWCKSCLKREFTNLNYMRRPVEASGRSQKGKILYDYYGASGVVDKIDDYIFEQTTLLIAEDGANLVLRNLPLIYIAMGRYWVNNHAHILSPKDSNDLGFMAYLLESIDYSGYITGAAQPKLSQDNLGRVPLDVPPLAEQKLIAASLDEQCGRIDKLIGKLNDEIALFIEYRTRLISDVVTGKLDVRGVNVPQYETVEDIVLVEAARNDKEIMEEAE